LDGLDHPVIGHNACPELPLARPRAFDEDKALDAAIECFWRHGLEATSVRDLASEMGINGPSLYNAFGGKHALFVMALERYAQRSMRERVERLEREASAKSAIRGLFHELIEVSIRDQHRRGCLIVNSALEIAPHDVELRGVIASYLHEIEMFFRRCLERGQEAGEIDPAVDPCDMARHFLGIVLGIRVAARFRPERALLEGMARPALARLDHRSRRKRGNARSIQ
jgi:TetR/AcrR family transcriptional repressor of nem operon